MNPLRHTDESHPVSRIAVRQHGVVSREQLLDADVSGSTIRNWLRRGRLRQVHQGVYLVQGAVDGWHAGAVADRLYVDRQARRIVAEHWVPHVAAVGGLAAAWLHGFPWVPRPDTPMVAANRASRTRRVLVSHVPELRDHDCREVDDVPTVAPGLALLGAAEGLRRGTVENLLVELPRRGLLSLPDVVATTQRFPSAYGGTLVVAALRQLTPELLRTRSGRERGVVRALHARGERDFEVNRRVRFPEATIEFDLLFGRHAEEVDGPHHLLPEQKEWDAERDRIAARHGITVHRTTTAELELDLDAAVTAMLARVHESRTSPPRSTS